jgi:hypothetical protein
VIHLGPIDIGDPRSLHFIELYDALHEKVIRASLIVGIVHMEGEHQTLMELDPESLEILSCPEAGES